MNMIQLDESFIKMLSGFSSTAKDNFLSSLNSNQSKKGA